MPDIYEYYSHTSSMKENNLFPKEIAGSEFESADRDNNPRLGDSSVYGDAGGKGGIEE